MLGAQQIDSIVKSRYAKKVNRKPASFATVLEQERDETLTPVETVVSANSTNTSGFQILSMTKRRPKPGVISVEIRRHTSTTNSAKDTDAAASTSTSEVPDDPTTRLANIRVLADEIRRREKGDDDVLGALQLTFDKKRLREIFPRRIEELEPLDESQQRRFMFNDDYISHLTSVMSLSSEALNDFLRAAGSKRTFSYGSSKYYDNQSFDEVLHCEWPAQTIALNLERRLLD